MEIQGILMLIVDGDRFTKEKFTACAILIQNTQGNFLNKTEKIQGITGNLIFEIVCIP
jgi:hypothetical protein